ncbi:MAG: flagellar filament capping protein FliD, partial [Desulfotomaculum sp.]|nr:flagellar filament capping protein FliD [Desulfotomaculum sp.]
SGGSGTNTLNLNLQTGVAATGTNAMINLGDAHHLEFNTNTFTVNGINITANQVMTTAGTITVASDVDTVVDSIKSFIELYNTTIGKVNQELLENRDRDYRPLTDAQREQMSETQQEQWEEIARSGLLRNDALLSSTVHRMRGAMSAMVSGLTNTLYDTLSEIGINTQNFQERGKLHIDEDRLRVALEADPEAMTALFTTSSTDYAQMGIAQRLQHDLDHHINLLTGRAGTDGSFVQFDSSAMGRRISNVNDEINRWEERLIALEDRHWRQFSAMERAINQMNQQSMWLAQQFGGGM